MKRKLIALALSCGLLLTACGSVTTNITDTTTDQTLTATQNDTPEEGSTSEDNSTDTDAESESASDTSSDDNSATQEKAPVLAEISLNIPMEYQRPFSGEKGTLDKISYMAQDYLGDGEPYEKFAYVYLPAGYDESKQYNVVYLMHGIGGNENEWGFNQGDNSRLKKLLDNLFGQGGVEPFIVVTPNGKALALSDTTGNDLFYRYAYELRNDLIPYIEGHYSTYAEYNEDGYDLSATRTHRAMAGLSMGGMQTINIGICECLDIFSWYGAFSAAPTSYDSIKLADYIDKSEYSIDYFYNICGVDDDIAYWSAAAAAKNLPALCDNITEAENFTWHEKSGGHDMGIWLLGMYNFSQLAFNDDASAESIFKE